MPNTINSAQLFDAHELTHSKMSTIPIKPGQWFLCTDTKEYYNDTKENTRIKVGDIIIVATESAREDILAPITGKFYYVTESGILYYYTGSAWFNKTYTASEITTSDNSTVQAKLDALSSALQNIGTTIPYSNTNVDIGGATNVQDALENLATIVNILLQGS